MAAVKQLCTKTIILEHGTVVFEGNTNDGIDYYFNLNEESKIRSGIYLSNITADNPFIKNVKLLSVNDLYSPCIRFYHDEEIVLDIEYSNRIPIVTFTVGIALLDLQKNKLFTNHFDFSQSREIAGKLRCKIPKDILNQGVYSFDVAIFQKGGVVFSYVESICEFDVIDRGSDLYYQVNEKIGPLRVACQWEIL
jgi:lipopolysaccharide transport system ATP-binding protein